MAGSITDMNRDSLASVSSSQDVHICCMTSSIDPVLLPIAIQLEYIFEKILECSSASENVSPLDIFLRQSFILESRTGLFTRACARSRPRSVSSPLESAKNMQFAKRLDAIDMERAVFIRNFFPKRVLKKYKKNQCGKEHDSYNDKQISVDVFTELHEHGSGAGKLTSKLCIYL